MIPIPNKSGDESTSLCFFFDQVSPNKQNKQKHKQKQTYKNTNKNKQKQTYKNTKTNKTNPRTFQKDSPPHLLILDQLWELLKSPKICQKMGSC